MAERKEQEVVRLEEWSLVSVDPKSNIVNEIDPDAYTADKWICLLGKAFGHPGFPDGVEVRTSKILYYKKNEDILVCKSRTYKIGCIKNDYEARFPDAKKRLLEAIEHR